MDGLRARAGIYKMPHKKVSKFSVGSLAAQKKAE
jgi:hypothetical protein